MGLKKISSPGGLIEDLRKWKTLEGFYLTREIGGRILRTSMH